MKQAEKINIVKNFLKLGAFLRREGDRMLSEFQLNQQGFVVLKQIQEKGPISQRDICSELLYEKSNISKIIKKLLNRKLISRAYSSEDGRVNSLRITPAGKKIARQCMERLNEWNSRWLEALSETEVRVAHKVLEKLSNVKELSGRYSK